MKRLKWVLAVAAAMVALIAPASPAYAIEDVSTNQLDTGSLVGLGLQTTKSADDRAFDAPSEAANPTPIPELLPQLGELTALSGPPLPQRIPPDSSR